MDYNAKIKESLPHLRIEKIHKMFLKNLIKQAVVTGINIDSDQTDIYMEPDDKLLYTKIITNYCIKYTNDFGKFEYRFTTQIG